ncbi:hypothetical protein Q453_0082 [Mesomycoplasma hyorhinis DBS 1050]|uniref:UpaP162 family type II restriction enzyme n=1 Tax=Mesomycoplasma hyorhinis TaxID=2100 RepID=UPI0003C53FFE|nr:hypothetical protein Q453_0082 [Mesomycoplasma hyorhinis DBS 1050]
MYYRNLKVLQSKVENYAKQIFKAYGNELVLKLEDYNLLEDENNCIESSTAIGFIIEEFLTSKISIYTKNHKEKEVIIHKKQISTTQSSYDSYAIFRNIFVMLNIKVEKLNSHNNAIAALNLLHNDYVQENPEQIKVYLILKINYKFDKSLKDQQRKIIINNIYSFFLEEVDFQQGHKQDHRNWSSIFNKNSGRLLISKNFPKLDQNSISYQLTKEFLINIIKKKNK